jgi:hypothetical protein
MNNESLDLEEAEEIYQKFQKELDLLMKDYFEEIKKIHQKITDKKIQNILKKLK